MREIKFRAWDKRTLCMMDVVTIDYDQKTVSLRDSESFYYELISEVDLLQYTGLKDSKGVEIYEGDIVQDCEGNTGEVNYIEDHCQFLINMGEGIDLQEIGSWAEVIGNIYEHSYLLDNKVQQ